MLIANAVVVVLAIMLSPAGTVHAQETDEAPQRTSVVREALESAAWEETEEGYFLIQARSESGQSIIAFRIPPDHFTFAITVQSEPKGERVEDFGDRTGALVAINGGFFGEEQKSGNLFPVGLLRVGGRNFSQAWDRAGGIATIEDGRVKLSASSAGVPERAENVLQSKPMLIEPGGKWAMNTNQGHLRPRSLLCVLANGEVVVVVVRGAGMSLYEVGWLMRAPETGGYFGCDAALALDGGGSTQLWVAGHDDLSFRGETPVHNALILRRRE